MVVLYPYPHGAKRDIADLRDYSYIPRPALLPAEHMPWKDLLTVDTLAVLVREQKDSTCVGHALAALIDIQLKLRGEMPGDRVSAAMLYQMARFYDLPDQDEQDPSDKTKGVRTLRSAIKGFFTMVFVVTADAAVAGPMTTP